jgi:hypothetical protein
VPRERKNRPVLITDAPEDPERELRRREIRYVIMMLVRALCLVAGAVLVSLKPPLWGVWVVLCVVGMVVLPWAAVILANDRAPIKRGQPRRPEPPAQPALPSPRGGRVIDGD